MLEFSLFSPRIYTTTTPQEDVPLISGQKDIQKEIETITPKICALVMKTLRGLLEECLSQNGWYPVFFFSKRYSSISDIQDKQRQVKFVEFQIFSWKHWRVIDSIANLHIHNFDRFCQTNWQVTKTINWQQFCVQYSQLQKVKINWIRNKKSNVILKLSNFLLEPLGNWHQC